MTYNATEISSLSGKPIELYDFFRSHLHWRFTSAQTALTVDYADYEAVAITRTAISLNTEINQATLSITVQRDNPVAEQWRISPPSEPILLILSQYHEGDGEVAVHWMGRIITVEWSGSTAKIILEPNYTSIKRPGLRRRYQRACPHVLYGPACRLTDDTFRLLSTVANIYNLDVQVYNANVNGDTYYAGGYIQWEIDVGIYERRYIVSHTGTTVVLATDPYSLIVGQEVKLFPGCDHTLATCNTKFGNSANFGGMPYIPAKNPFGGTPIF